MKTAHVALVRSIENRSIISGLRTRLSEKTTVPKALSRNKERRDVGLDPLKPGTFGVAI